MVCPVFAPPPSPLPFPGAQFCLFEADDDTLANFTDRGSLFTTNVTFGEVDTNIVWQPNNVSANMMECPDLFPLGEKHVRLTPPPPSHPHVCLRLHVPLSSPLSLSLPLPLIRTPTPTLIPAPTPTPPAPALSPSP